MRAVHFTAFLAALAVAELAPGQDVLKPFTPDDGKPVMRAVPVRPPRVVPADPVEDSADANGDTPPAAAAATPRKIPVRKAKPVKATPSASAPARPAAPPAAPEPIDPGEIRISPQAGAKTSDQVQMEMADGYYARKMYEMAAPEYQRYIDQYPGGADMQTALFRLAQCYRQSGSLNNARNMYEELLGRFQVGEFVGPAAYFLAQMQYQEKSYSAAELNFRKASERLKDPGVANAAKFFTARCLEAEGQKTEARGIYDELASIKENNLFRDISLLSSALLLKEGKDTAGALREAQALLRQTGNAELQAEAAVHAGIWELELGQKEKAATDLQKALEMPGIGHWKEVAELGLARLYYDGGKYRQVIDVCAQQSGQVSAEIKPELLLLAADAQRQLGNYPEALQGYDQISKSYPASPSAKEAAYDRLACLYRMGDARLSPEIEAFLSANPDAERRDDVLLMKAEGLYKKQDYQSAAPVYEAVAKSVRLSANLKAEALFKLGWCAMQIRDFDRAIKSFTEFIDGSPGNKSIPYALIQRALAYQTKKDLVAAEKDFDTIIKKYPDAAKERELALHQKALIRGQQNDNAGMMEAFERLLADYPNSAAAPEAHFWIGSVAFDAKNYRKAAEQLNLARVGNNAEYFERATLRIILCYYYIEDAPGVAREVELYGKSGKSKAPVDVLRWLCAQLDRGGSYAEEEKYLEMVAARDEAQPKDFLELGEARLKLDKFAPAEEALEKYLSRVQEPPSRALGLLQLSKARIGRQDYNQAQKSVDEALMLQPEGKISGEARIVAGDIQVARGNFEEAAKLYMSVAVILDEETVTPVALEKAVEAYQKAHRDAEAKKTLNVLQSRYPEYIQRIKLAK